ncbi:MAG: MerR family transcriptional regulator [Desulfomonilia bacterium]|jgi:predicted RNase H-like HicB family nuclease|nr:MerR family transcriptional regulator [Deltaproteobacteria bacterium]HOD79651.1 MerR family transcriptional regulator [Syntrophorhabdus sp.]HQQ15300.1 MerR family transcriptional regulator [Deltaproteobacteria bacterium]
MNFNTKTVARILGLTTRQIGYWDKTNLIKPSVQEAAGYGSVRLYSFSDLIQLKVAKALKDAGISIQKMRKALIYLEKNMPDIDKPLANLKFLSDGESIFVITKDKKTIIDTLNRGQVVFTFLLDDIINELKGTVRPFYSHRKYEVSCKGRKYSVILHEDTEDGGYWAECPEIPGCVSQGDTIRETLEMIKDAIDGCLDVIRQNENISKAL